jgi:hypothetical protein
MSDQSVLGLLTELLCVPSPSGWEGGLTAVITPKLT